MELVMLGTGGAYPDPDKSAPAFAIIHNDTPFLIDCGGGACHQLVKANINPNTIDNVLLTHIHIDHCVEFPSLVFGAYLTGKKNGFNVYGPEGTTHFVNSIFDDTYNFAKQMMINLRNQEIIIQSNEYEEGTVYNDNGLEIMCLPMKHGIKTLAYKFTAEGKSIVFSADTAPCDNIIKLAKDCDILVMECSFPESAGPKSGHCIPSQVGEIATAANVKHLILTHLFPVCKGHESEMLKAVNINYKGVVEIATDLQRFSI